jgi:hypothetical protein
VPSKNITFIRGTIEAINLMSNQTAKNAIAIVRAEVKNLYNSIYAEQTKVVEVNKI